MFVSCVIIAETMLDEYTKCRYMYLNDSRPLLLACPEFFTNPQQLEIFDASSEQIAWAGAWREPGPCSTLLQENVSVLCRKCVNSTHSSNAFCKHSGLQRCGDNCVLSNNASCPRPTDGAIHTFMSTSIKKQSPWSASHPAQPSPAQLRELGRGHENLRP